MNFWLMKSEPDEFSIDDLQRIGTEPWQGVRNYLARNYLRAMQVGDQAFFYHSSCPEPGIVGIASIVRSAYADASAWEPGNPYFDAKSTQENPRWSVVDVGFVKKFPRILSLAALKQNPHLADFTLLQKGNRLSVMPLTPAQWHEITSTHTLIT